MILFSTIPIRSIALLDNQMANAVFPITLPAIPTTSIYPDTQNLNLS
jgi:hypothetical protein